MHFRMSLGCLCCFSKILFKSRFIVGSNPVLDAFALAVTLHLLFIQSGISVMIEKICKPKDLSYIECTKYEKRYFLSNIPSCNYEECSIGFQELDILERRANLYPLVGWGWFWIRIYSSWCWIILGRKNIPTMPSKAAYLCQRTGWKYSSCYSAPFLPLSWRLCIYFYQDNELLGVVSQ